MKKEKFKMVDKVVGVCVGLAAGKIMKDEILCCRKFRECSDLTKVGCAILPCWVAFRAGMAATKDTEKIRKALIKTFFESED